MRACVRFLKARQTHLGYMRKHIASPLSLSLSRALSLVCVRALSHSLFLRVSKNLAMVLKFAPALRSSMPDQWMHWAGAIHDNCSRRW
jgi:hypothetical protein